MARLQSKPTLPSRRRPAWPRPDAHAHRSPTRVGSISCPHLLHPAGVKSKGSLSGCLTDANSPTQSRRGHGDGAGRGGYYSFDSANEADSVRGVWDWATCWRLPIVFRGRDDRIWFGTGQDSSTQPPPGMPPLTARWQFILVLWAQVGRSLIG